MTYVELTLTTQGGDVYTITNKDIAQGGLSVNGYSCNGDFLEVGTAISKEMKLTLENIDGRWDDVEFIGDTCDLKQLEMSTWNSMAEGDYEEMVIGDGTVYVDYTKIVNDTSLDLGSRTFLMTDFTCIDSEDVLSSNLTPGATYTMLSNPSSVATFRMVEKNGSTTVGTHDINGTEYRFIATEGNTYQFYAVMLQTVPARSKFDINFVLSETTTIPLGTYIIDDCTYSRGRVSLTALDFLYKLDVYPAVLNDYSEVGFQVYSVGANVCSQPIDSFTFGSTIQGQTYTIAEIYDNGFGDLWFRLNPTDTIYNNVRRRNMPAGDSAWILTTDTTGTLYPYEHANAYSVAGVTTGYTTMYNLLRAEIKVNDTDATNYGLFDLDAAAWNDLKCIELNLFALGNQFTLRQLVGWCAGLMGKCVCQDMSSVARLKFKWYETTAGSYSDATAYSMELQKKAISVTGFSAERNGGLYKYGTNDYMISIGENPLMDAFQQVTVDNVNYTISGWLEQLYNRLSGISYVPFAASVVETPTCLVLDNITYGDMTLPVTDWTWTLNGATQLRGRGSTTVNKGYASSSGSVSSPIPYSVLTGKPTINGVRLVPGLTGEDLQLEPIQSWKRYTLTRTDNSYVNATDASRLYLDRYGHFGSLYLNLHISTSMPSNTASVEVGTYDCTLLTGVTANVTSQSGNGSSLTITLNSSGVLSIGNYSGTASGAVWFRGTFPVIFSDSSN